MAQVRASIRRTSIDVEDHGDLDPIAVVNVQRGPHTWTLQVRLRPGDWEANAVLPDGSLVGFALSRRQRGVGELTIPPLTRELHG